MRLNIRERENCSFTTGKWLEFEYSIKRAGLGKYAYE